MFEEMKAVSTKEELIVFLNWLAKDYEVHQEEWANLTIPEYLSQIASWIEDVSASPYNDVAWEAVDYSIIVRLLTMGKLYE